MEIPRHWRLKDIRYRLQGVVCENGRPLFPPQPVCPECHGITPIHPDFKKGSIYNAEELPTPISLPTEASMSSK